MSVLSFRQWVIGAIAATVVLGGCSSAPSLPSTQGSTASVPSIALPDLERTIFGVQVADSVSRPDAQLYGEDGTWVYSAQFYGEDATVYKRVGLRLTRRETLTYGFSSPQGMMATINGWLYIANGGDSNVLVYRSTKRGPKGPVQMLDDSGQIPANVSVTPNRQLVAVSNVTTASHGTGSISVYLDRQTTPTRNLTYGTAAVQGVGIAIDHHGNCYWSVNDSSNHTGTIVEFTGCSGKGTPVISKIAYAGGLAFDQRDDLYYVDQMAGIYKCAKGTSHCALFAKGFGDPVNINFDLRQKHLWVADASGYIDAVDTKTGAIVSKTPTGSGSKDAPFGVAPAPGGSY